MIIRRASIFISAKTIGNARHNLAQTFVIAIQTGLWAAEIRLSCDFRPARRALCAHIPRMSDRRSPRDQLTRGLRPTIPRDNGARGILGEHMRARAPSPNSAARGPKGPDMSPISAGKSHFPGKSKGIIHKFIQNSRQIQWFRRDNDFQSTLISNPIAFPNRKPNSFFGPNNVWLFTKGTRILRDFLLNSSISS